MVMAYTVLAYVTMAYIVMASSEAFLLRLRCVQGARREPEIQGYPQRARLFFFVRGSTPPGEMPTGHASGSPRVPSAYIVMACICMAYNSNGLYSYGLHSYGT